jgi:hypothetical protein
VVTRGVDGSFSNPVVSQASRCVTPAELAPAVLTEFTSMRIPAPRAVLQGPPGDILYVNVWYPAFVEADPVTHQAVLLEVPVEIRATAARFVWDWDDPFSTTGGSLTTTYPGVERVEGDPPGDRFAVAHMWDRLGDPDTRVGFLNGTARNPDNGMKYRTDVTVTVQTTWTGEFRVQGSPTWTSIPGAILTTSQAGTFGVTEARALLYCEDLNGNRIC